MAQIPLQRRGEPAGRGGFLIKFNLTPSPRLTPYPSHGGELVRDRQTNKKKEREMKKLLVMIGAMFICTFAIAHTVNWHVGDQIISTTTCDSGDNITPPTPPTKYGYTFKNWRIIGNLFKIDNIIGANDITVSGDVIILNKTVVHTGKTLHQLVPILKAGDTIYYHIEGTARNYLWLQGGAAEGFWPVGGQPRTLSQEDLDGGVKFYCEEPGQTIEDLYISFIPYEESE